jgi:hypothetical protein
VNKNNNTDGLDSFFSYVSKAVIVIPIIIFIFSLFFKFATPKNSVPNLNSVTPSVIPVIKKNTIKFDLQGPIVCDSLFVKDKKVLFKNKLTNYLLNGDCLYIWEQGKVDGEMKCSLSNYIKMAENYLAYFNIDDLINNNLVKDLIKNKGINLENVVKSCKRKEIKDKTIFEIPKQVLFKNK